MSNSEKDKLRIMNIYLTRNYHMYILAVFPFVIITSLPFYQLEGVGGMAFTVVAQNKDKEKYN